MLLVSKRVRERYTRLFVSNVLGPSLAIELQLLEVPLHRRGIGQKAGLAIARLLMLRSVNRKSRPIRAKRIAELYDATA
jgi:hypothetical protein